jgi:outer membrane protein OmpA-like peptidoglycan-associated protein
LASAFRLTLASQLLNPPIDPTTGSRPSASIAEAVTLLNDVCDESGLVALQHELLARYSEDLPPRFAQSVPPPAVAWDGRARDGQPVATYSQPNLERVAASVHYCSKQMSIAPALRSKVRELAIDVKNANPTRVIVVGHSDVQGTCSGSEAVALERAASVKQALRAAGISEELISTVSLGKRHPLSFTRDDASHLLNRRVEILIERAADEQPPLEIDHGPLLPECH